MLKKILSITGKPGLFKIISNGKNMLLLEDVISHKRIPAHGRDKLVSLGDITMYSETEDVPLSELLDRAKNLYEGKPVDLKAMQAGGTLRDEFARILPDFDRDRVYDGDIRKFFSWYNLLIQAGLTDFLPAEADNAEEAPAEASAE